jgi:hypothetical protein
LIYNAEPGIEPVEVARLDLPKKLAMHEFHGGGPHPIDDVEVILSQGFGDGFAQRMARRGIVAFATDKTDPVDAVMAYLARLRTAPEAPASASRGCGHNRVHAHAHRHQHGHGAQRAARDRDPERRKAP